MKKLFIILNEISNVKVLAFNKLNFITTPFIFLFLLIVFFGTFNLSAQNHSATKTPYNMKLNAGIITDKLTETKAFYTDHLGFGVTFENEFYLLLHTPNQQAQISFLLPNHPSQQPLFQQAYQGKGMFFTIEMEEVDELYKTLKEKGVEIKIELRDEPWGDRHFAIEDPNGIGIDFVKYTKPENN